MGSIIQKEIIGAYYVILTQTLESQTATVLLNGNRVGDSNTDPSSDESTLAYGPHSVSIYCGDTAFQARLLGCPRTFFLIRKYTPISTF